MKNILKIMMHDFKQISTNVVALVVIMGLSILPSLYAWFNINSNWEPYSEDATSNLKIAVYSNDEGMMVNNLELCIGNSVLDALRENDSIGWVFPEDERTAINGVYSGDYYAALVIPENFTQSIAAVLDGDTSGGTITYYSNEKKNAIATKITSKAEGAVEEQVNSQVFSTITQIVVKAGDALKNAQEDSSVLQETAQWLTMLEEDVQRYINILDTLAQSMDSAAQSMTALSSLVLKMAEDMEKDLSQIPDASRSLNGLQTAGIRLSDYVDVLGKGQTSLKKTKTQLTDLKTLIKKMKKDLLGTQDSESLEKVVSVLENDPERVGEYFSSLVNLKTIPVYKTSNYGSAMAPFYTVLAIWVGALILVAVLHTKVKDVPNLHEVKPYQEFFGRYALFFGVGQIQTLICVLGNLFFLEIQCKHPFLFWFAAAMTSFVFTIFIYSLTFAFGNVGEALAVVIMVLQVAGAGGTFPKEVLPQVYQDIYKFMPFPYCMDALRECVSGMYRNDYWVHIGRLGIFIGTSLVIGLVLYRPFVKLNLAIERSKENSDLMV